MKRLVLIFTQEKETKSIYRYHEVEAADGDTKSGRPTGNHRRSDQTRVPLR